MKSCMTQLLVTTSGGSDGMTCLQRAIPGTCDCPGQRVFEIQLLRVKQQMGRYQMNAYSFKAALRMKRRESVVLGVRTCSHNRRRIRRGLNPSIFKSYRLARGSFCIRHDLHVLPTFVIYALHICVFTQVMAFPSRYMRAFIYRKMSTVIIFCCFVNHNSYGLGQFPSNSQFSKQ